MSSTVERKLAAIMFTDIAGYTAQMSADESKAIDLLNKKESILKTLLENHKGTFVKAIGDGTLTYFESAVNAATCAVKLQEITYDNPDLNIRAGIHIGDIVFKDDDVFGDGVNISSRLESMAPVGGVCVSKNVYDELINQDGFEGVDLGLQSLKGVGRLVEVYGLKGSKLKEPDPSDYQENKVAVHKDEEVPSITIIPFDNKGADEDVFYAYGISSDLISDIASAGVIRVAGMKEVEDLGDMPFKDKAKKLNTRYVSTGTLWKMGEMFQLSIELHDTKESTIIWSDRWQEKWENLTIIKEKLSISLLETLNTKPKVESSIANHNTEAYEYYLKAKFKIESQGLTKEGIEVGRSLADKAIELDPLLIEPRALLMATYVQVGEFKTVAKMAKVIKELAKKSDNPKHLAAGYAMHALQIFMEGFNTSGELDKSNLKKVKSLLEKSMAINKNINDLKNLAKGKGMMVMLFGLIGDFKKSISLSEELIALGKKVDDKPEMMKSYMNIAMTYDRMGDYTNAIKYINIFVDFYKKENPMFLVQGLYYRLESILKQGKNLTDDYLNELYAQAEKSTTYADADLIALAGLYANMGLIKIIQKDYSAALQPLLKAKEIGEKLPNIDSSARIFIAFSKKMLGEDISDKLNDLEKTNHNSQVDAYYLYKIFGSDEGKKYLEKGFNIISDMKIHLEDKVLEEFCNAKYVKLISEEWKKINN